MMGFFSRRSIAMIPVSMAAAGILVFAAACSSSAPAQPAPASGGAAPAATSAPAQKEAAAPAGTITAKFASVAAEDHPHHKSFVFFADRVKELTNGKLVVQVFPNSQLGNEREYIEQLQIGQIEFAKSSAAVLGPFVPQFQVFDLPYVFKSKDQLFKHTDGEVGQTLIKLAEDKLGIRVFGFFDAGTRSIFNSKKPVKTPADLKGMKIRVMENPLMIQTLNAMGAQATPLAVGEQYSAIQQGVLDGAENSPVFYRSQKFYEVAKYYSYTEHFMTPDTPMVSLKWYNAQPKEIQQAIDQAGKEMIKKERELWLEYEKFVVDDLKSKGILFNEVEDKAAFAKLVEGIYGQFEGKIGKDLIQKATAQ
ncbi:MAG: TRAP transporter substrate-binding protein [Sphingomonadaceae bacterium]